MQESNKRQEWVVHLNNKKLSKKEKFIKIKEKAREIEEMALRKEQLLNVKSHDALKGIGGLITRDSIMPSITKNEKNIEETLEVNNMLVDAIKAKLAILDNIHMI